MLPKPPHLSWEEAAAPTARRHHRLPDAVRLGGQHRRRGRRRARLGRRRRPRHAGDPARRARRRRSRSRSCRAPRRASSARRSAPTASSTAREFDHWGMPPHWTDDAGQKQWTASARAFGKRIWDIVGERRNPAIVFEHPGEATIPTSIFVCEGGGMVVICAGTTGYRAIVDLRYHWVRQKRLQGSHGTNDEQARAWATTALRRRDRPRARARAALRRDRPGPPGHGRRRPRERQHRNPRRRRPTRPRTNRLSDPRARHAVTPVAGAAVTQITSTPMTS